MQRIFGAIAIFSGWMTIPIGAVAGLLASEFFGLGHSEGAPPIETVYGFSGLMVLWVFVAAAILTAVPLAAAMVAADPRRTAMALAVALTIAGLVLTPDPLGRAFGLPLLAGAACLWIGGELVRREGPMLVGASSQAPQPAVDGATPDRSQPTAGGPADSTTAVTATDSSPLVAPQQSPAAAIPQTAAKPKGGRGSRTARGRTGVAARICSWCSAEAPAGIGTCPNCGATLDAQTSDGIPIPGLTEVPTDLQRYIQDARSSKKRQSLLDMMLGDTPIPIAIDAPPPSDAAALRPPSPQLKAEMARIDAEIAARAASLGAEADAEANADGASTTGTTAGGAPASEPPEKPAAQ